MRPLQRWIYRRTLRWVNRQRDARGNPTLAELPLGQIKAAGACPTARGLGGGALVGRSRFAYAGDDHQERWLPLYVRQFAAWFDHHRYPDLIAPTLSRAERELRAEYESLGIVLDLETLRGILRGAEVAEAVGPLTREEWREAINPTVLTGAAPEDSHPEARLPTEV